jgi:hypothetical protein
LNCHRIFSLEKSAGSFAYIGLDTFLETVLRHALHIHLYEDVVSGGASCPGSRAAQLSARIDTSIDAFIDAFVSRANWSLAEQVGRGGLSRVKTLTVTDRVASAVPSLPSPSCCAWPNALPCSSSHDLIMPRSWWLALGGIEHKV